MNFHSPSQKVKNCLHLCHGPCSKEDYDFVVVEFFEAHLCNEAARVLADMRHDPQQVLKIAYSPLWAISRHKVASISKEDGLNFFKVKIRSVLEYTAPVFSPMLAVENVYDIERIQKSERRRQLSLTFIHFYSLLLTFIHLYSLLLTFTHFYSLLLTFTHFYSLLLCHSHRTVHIISDSIYLKFT